MNSLILDLNDDCLVSILTYLPIKDHLHFAHVCTRFRNVVVFNAKSLYKRVELTGTSEEYLLMHVVGVGDLVKNLYFTFDEEWVGDLNVLLNTIGCLINLEQATLNFSCPVPLPKILAIIQDLAKLPLLKDITMVKDAHVTARRWYGPFIIPSGLNELEKVLKTLKEFQRKTMPRRCGYVMIQERLNNSR